jgi:hypothetical protein
LSLEAFNGLCQSVLLRKTLEGRSSSSLSPPKYQPARPSASPPLPHRGGEHRAIPFFGVFLGTFLFSILPTRLRQMSPPGNLLEVIFLNFLRLGYNVRIVLTCRRELHSRGSGGLWTQTVFRCASASVQNSSLGHTFTALVLPLSKNVFQMEASGMEQIPLPTPGPTLLL